MTAARLLLATVVALVGSAAVVVALLVAPARPTVAAPTGLDAMPRETTQAVVVTAPAADATTATVAAWERRPTGWTVVLGPVPAHLGDQGIGEPSETADRTPAGTFPITSAFGRAPDPGARLPYRQVGPDDWWVADVASPLYNTPQVCAPGTCPFDEADAEHLVDAGPAYDHAIVLDANTAPTVPGAGSAYFLHVGAGPTAGCVATDDATVVALLRRLDPARHPVVTLGVAPV